MKDLFRNISHRCAAVLSRSAFLAKAAQRIADYRKGNNNPDMATNGELDFLARRADGLRLVFDVGANKGDWTRAVLKLKKDVQVIAFEPDPAMYEIFAADRFPENVNCENEGLGAEKGEFTLYVHASSGMNSFVKRGMFDEGELTEKKARITTVDAYCAEHHIEKVDYMKIDVEGFELGVLRGAQRMLKEKRIAALQFEYGGTYLDSGISLREIFDLLHAAGYAVYKLLPREAMKIDAYSPLLEDYQYSNYAAVAE